MFITHVAPFLQGFDEQALISANKFTVTQTKELSSQSLTTGKLQFNGTDKVNLSVQRASSAHA